MNPLNPFESGFDAVEWEHSFLASGLANRAIYTPAQGECPSREVVILANSDAQSFGFDSQVPSAGLTFRVQRAQVGAPVLPGAVFALDDTRYIVDRVTEPDSSTYLCSVSREDAR